jgi:hypothetical protein
MVSHPRLKPVRPGPGIQVTLLPLCSSSRQPGKGKCRSAQINKSPTYTVTLFRRFPCKSNIYTDTYIRFMDI